LKRRVQTEAQNFGLREGKPIRGIVANVSPGLKFDDVRRPSLKGLQELVPEQGFGTITSTPRQEGG